MSNALTRIAHMRFSEPPFDSGIYQDVFRTMDDRFIETAVYTGRDYEEMTFISITTQVGCPVACSFCEVSKVPLVRNLTRSELIEQVEHVVDNANDVKWLTKRPIKVSLGRAGEPLLNPETTAACEHFAFQLQADIQLFSVFPEAPVARKNLDELQEIAARMPGIFQATVSLHTTNESSRSELMPRGKLMSFNAIAERGTKWVEQVSKRPINLSLILIDGIDLDFHRLRSIFSPDIFCVRLAYYLPTTQEMASKHKPSSDDRLAIEVEKALEAGFRVISSPAGPLERFWDTRPFSTFNMFRLPYRPTGR